MSDKFSIGEKLVQFAYRSGYHRANHGQEPEIHLSEPTLAKSDYVFFGHFPQTIKAEDVWLSDCIEDNIYRGSDGALYCKIVKTRKDILAGPYTYAMPQMCPNDAYVFRYSNGEKNGDCFKIEPIQWRVVHRENGILTLLSEHILFNHFIKDKVEGIFALKSTGAWDSSEARKLLNDRFFRTAFSAKERDCILTTRVDVETEGMKLLDKIRDTSCEDKVYILSKTECKTFGFNSDDLAKHQTDFVGAYVDYTVPSTPNPINGPWLTRSVAGSTIFAEGTVPKRVFVSSNGTLWTSESASCYSFVPVIRVREEDVTVHRDRNSNEKYRTRKDSDDDSYNDDSDDDRNYEEDFKPTPNPPQPPLEMTTGRKIKYSFLAFGAWLLGEIAAVIFAGARGFSDFPAILWLASIIVCEILIWTKKSVALCRFAIFLAFVVSFAIGAILGVKF